MGWIIIKIFNYNLGSNGGNLYIRYRDPGATWRVWNTGHVLPEEVWEHVATVWTASAGNTNIEVLINGVSIGATVLTNQPDFDLLELDVGAAGFAPAEFFEGDIDEPQIIGAELTAPDILIITQRGYARVLPSAVVDLRFEEGVGLIAHDDSPLGNDGALLPVVNPPLWINVQQFQLLAEADV